MNQARLRVKEMEESKECCEKKEGWTEGKKAERKGGKGGKKEGRDKK